MKIQEKKKVMCDNVDDKKNHSKKEESKRKKEKRDNLANDEKEQLGKYKKKGKKVMHDNFGDGKKEQGGKNDKKERDKRSETSDERASICNNVQMCSIADPCIPTTTAFRLIEEYFRYAIQEGPTYICDICWKFEFRKNVIKLKEPKY